MPAAFSHWILGKRITESQKFSEEFLTLDKAAFLWGCQGPDIFFYHRLMPWQKKDSLRDYGYSLHTEDPARLFKSLAKVCRYAAGSPGSNLMYSYALGLCCHYCYDRALHPLVFYNDELLKKTDERGKDFKYHCDIEANMDGIMLMREFGKTCDCFSMREDCLPYVKGLDGAVSGFYTLLFMDLYNIRISHASASTLVSDFRLNLGMLDDRTGYKKPIVLAVEKYIPNISNGSVSGLMHDKDFDIGFDYANLLKNTWFNPDDHSKKSNMTLYEITNKAYDDTLELMELFARAVMDKNDDGFEAFVGGIDFSGRAVKQ